MPNRRDGFEQDPRLSTGTSVTILSNADCPLKNFAVGRDISASRVLRNGLPRIDSTARTKYGMLACVFSGNQLIAYPLSNPCEGGINSLMVSRVLIPMREFLCNGLDVA